MIYNKLAVSLFFSGMLLLSGCGNDTKVNPVPVEEAPEETTSPGEITPSEETTSPGETTAPATQNPTVASTTITTTSGKSIKVNRTASGLIFEGNEGKIVLLEIYGDTCPFCVEAIPGYNRLQAQYPNDVYIITLESYGKLNNAGLQQYAAANGIQYDTVALENSGNIFEFIQDMTGYTTKQGVPALLILSRDGDLAEYLPPQVLNEAYVDGLIQSLL